MESGTFFAKDGSALTSGGRVPGQKLRLFEMNGGATGQLRSWPGSEANYEDVSWSGGWNDGIADTHAPILQAAGQETMMENVSVPAAVQNQNRAKYAVQWRK